MEQPSAENLLLRIEELENRLEESEQLIEAIKAGEVDAFALNTNNQQEIYTLQSGDYAYRVLVENFNEGALNLSEDGLIVYTNNYFHNLLGLTYEKVIGNHIFNFIHTSSADDFSVLFKKGLAGQSKGEINLSYGDKIMPVYISFTSLQPTLPTVSMIVTDLSEKKRTETELKEKNKFIETIIESSHEMIAVYDKDCRLISMNKATEDFMNKKREDVLGKTLTEIYPAEKNAKAETDLLKALQGNFIQNDPYLSPSIKKYFQNYIIPLRDDKGNVYAALAIGSDVTNIKKTEEELRVSQEHFSKLFSVSPVAMSLSYASDGKVIDVNETWEKLFGISRTYAVGKTATQMNISNTEERNAKAKEILESGGTSHGLQMNYIKPDGSILFAFLSIETIEMNGMQCLLVAYFDLSERMQAEEAIKTANRLLEEKNKELERSNAELASFSYVASHDLQEPLRKIQTFSNIIAENEFAVLSEQGKIVFNRMEAAAKRMQTLINDLLSYSRTTTGDRNFELMLLDEMVQEVKDALKEEIKEKNAVVQSDAAVEINVIAFQFRQLLNNLISNSLKFTLPGKPPHIKIRAEIIDAGAVKQDVRFTEKKYCHISINDNGIGFEPQYNKKIFELFQRLNGNHQYTGTGIGLAIVKRIVENHDGIITAHGEINKGAGFDIYIPQKLE